MGLATDWNKVKCYECKQCNRKGKPSVMKGSLYCEKNRGIITPERLDIAEKFWDLLPFKHMDIKSWFKSKKKQEKEEKEKRENEKKFNKGS